MDLMLHRFPGDRTLFLLLQTNKTGFFSEIDINRYQE